MTTTIVDRPAIWKIRFTVEAGLLVRGQARSSIAAISAWHDVQCRIYEYKGFLGSTFTIILSGNKTDCTKTLEEIQRLISRLSQ